MEDDYKQYLSTPIRNDRKPLQELLPVDRPLRLLIDPCDACNFRCEFCFQSKGKFPGRKMKQETFDLLAEQLSQFNGPINVVHMYGLGEPLMNERLPLFIEVLKTKNLAKEVAITTNGSLLTHQMSERLVAAGTDRISISLNGLSDESFQKHVGVKVDFSKMYEEIKYLYSIKGNCHLHVKINEEEYTEGEKRSFVSMFKEITDTINLDHIVNVWPGLEVTEDKEHRMYDYDLENLAVNDTQLPKVCPLMFYELLVHSDGTVSPCAVDYGFKKENLGNIFEASIKQIWESEKLRKIRVEALKGECIDYQMCNVCDYADCAATVNITPFRSMLLKKYE